MTVDEQAAAERLRRYKHGDPRPYERPGEPHEIDLDRVERDRHLLADAYCAANPDDDGEPVTAEWLESNGFVRGCFDDRCYGWHHGIGCYSLNLVSLRGNVSNIDVSTRGDVRRLLAALNLLTPPNPSPPHAHRRGRPTTRPRVLRCWRDAGT